MALKKEMTRRSVAVYENLKEVMMMGLSGEVLGDCGRKWTRIKAEVMFFILMVLI